MAKYSNDQIVYGDNSEIPAGVYTVRITKMVFKRSKEAKKPMIEAAGEIVSPATVECGGKQVQVAGRPLRNWYNLLDPASTYGLGRLIEGLRRGGLDPAVVQSDYLDEGEIFNDGEGDPKALQLFVGKSVNMRVDCKPRDAMRPPTEAEKAAGKTDYQPLLDPATGKPLTSGYQLETSWGNVVGPAEDGEAGGF